MKLNLKSLREALASLEKSLGYLGSDLARDPGMREQFRAAGILSFEFTYAVAIRMIKRQLEQISFAWEELVQMEFMDLIRSAAEAGLITDVARFRLYRDKRNITSHAYDQDKAEEIVAVLPAFRDDIRSLLAELERRNRAD